MSGLLRTCGPHNTRKGKYRRQAYKIDPVIGVPYGTTFELRGTTLVQCEATLDETEFAFELDATEGEIFAGVIHDGYVHSYQCAHSCIDSAWRQPESGGWQRCCAGCEPRRHHQDEA